MRNQTSLSARATEVLHSIVENYIATGEPVASRSISRARRDSLSPATIRNVMADLSDEGYLEQPHTSAGRIPTQKAFRTYIHSLSAARIAAGDVARLRSELCRLDTLEARVERSSHLLTEITHNIGITAAIPAASQTLNRIELLTLEGGRVLMIIATRDGMVHNRVVSMEDAVTQDELNSIRNYVNVNFSGWKLPQIQSELKRRLEEESAAYDAILSKLAVLYQKGLLEIGLTPEIHAEGAANLMDVDLRLTRETLRELFRALEEKKRILQLLDLFLEHPIGELATQVGLAQAHPSMQDLSLVGLRINLPNGVTAKIAVVGPVRMNYGRVISAVLHVGQAFQAAPE
jgi:heat-inducible transcriptional repressor